jgi:hypothetical protein
MISRDTYDRLIKPVFLQSLPSDMRKIVNAAFEHVAPYVRTHHHSDLSRALGPLPVATVLRAKLAAALQPGEWASGRHAVRSQREIITGAQAHRCASLNATQPGRCCMLYELGCGTTNMSPPRAPTPVQMCQCQCDMLIAHTSWPATATLPASGLGVAAPVLGAAPEVARSNMAGVAPRS